MSLKLQPSVENEWYSMVGRRLQGVIFGNNNTSSTISFADTQYSHSIHEGFTTSRFTPHTLEALRVPVGGLVSSLGAYEKQLTSH